MVMAYLSPPLTVLHLAALAVRVYLTPEHRDALLPTSTLRLIDLSDRAVEDELTPVAVDHDV
jgi:hypothetical protein